MRLQNFIWLSLENLRVETIQTKFYSEKPKYRYAKCDNGTEFLFSRNDAAQEIAGAGWCRYLYCQWFSEKEYELTENDNL